MPLSPRRHARARRTRWAVVFIALPFVTLFGFDSAAHGPHHENVVASSPQQGTSDVASSDALETVGSA